MLRYAFLKETHRQKGSSDFGAGGPASCAVGFIKAGDPYVKYIASLDDHITQQNPATALGWLQRSRPLGLWLTLGNQPLFLCSCKIPCLPFPRSLLLSPPRIQSLQRARRTPQPISFLVHRHLLLLSLQCISPLRQQEQRPPYLTERERTCTSRVKHNSS